MGDLGFTGRLARFSARHRWSVIAAWVVGLAALAGVAFGVGGVFTSDMKFTNDEESQVARELLKAARGEEPLFEQVIVQSQSLTVDDPAFETFVTGLAGDIRALDADVEFAVTFYETGLPDLVSADRHTTLIPTKLVGDIDSASEHIDPLLATLREHDRDGFTVLTTGFASLNHTFEKLAESDLSAETRALPVALVVLILVFGAVVAALVPLLLAFFAILLATAAATLLSNAFPLSIFVTNMIVMIGLAVGIDYSLLIVERFREERRHGLQRMEAIGAAGDTASRAVLFSGATVVIALLGLLIVPSSIMQALGIGAILAAVAAVLVGLTLLPAVLGVLGDRVNRLAVPFLSRNRGRGEEGRGFWAAVARQVMAHPWYGVVLSSALLVALALPYAGIELGFAEASTFPPRTEAYRAFQVMDREFSAGRSLPTEIVVRAGDVTAPEVAGAMARLRAAIVADGEIRPNPSPTDGASADGTIALMTVSLPGDVASDEAQAALRRLRESIIPSIFGDLDAEVFVGGLAAQSVDFFDMIGRYTPVVFAFVLGLSFVLLLLVFRSLIVPLKAVVMNLLSVGAAYGLLVLVFQHGVGADLLGVQRSPIIEAWVPILLFAILFGLSMDYHVFLLSRIRERYDHTGHNAESVAFGLRSTANIITGAAAIMVAVFGGFVLGELVAFQQMGFGLAVAVFLDATVVRMVLVPSAMELLGDRNWYLPAWLEWLPDLRVEGPAERATPSGMIAGG